MDFHLAVTNYVGSISTLFNGLFVVLILSLPPDNLGMFRSQYYVGAFASFFFAATQLWSAFVVIPNGTLHVMFPGRESAGKIGFLSFFASINLQFTMLSSNFAVRFAAVRGGWMKAYLTNHFLFYGIQFSMAMGAYVTLIPLVSPTPDLRAMTQDTYGEKYSFDFLNDYYFVSSYECPILGSAYAVHSLFIFSSLFQAINLLIMLVCGLITYLHIHRYTQSLKLREVNNRLLRIRIIQALFSFAFLFMPGLLMNSSMLLRKDVSSIALYLSSLFTLATFFNPFLEFALTPGYRKRILKTLFNVTDMSKSTEKTVSIATVQFSRHSQAPKIIHVK